MALGTFFLLGDLGPNDPWGWCLLGRGARVPEGGVGPRHDAGHGAAVRRLGDPPPDL